jgi:hypothetical protein
VFGLSVSQSVSSSESVPSQDAACRWENKTDQHANKLCVSISSGGYDIPAAHTMQAIHVMSSHASHAGNAGPPALGILPLSSKESTQR